MERWHVLMVSKTMKAIRHLAQEPPSDDIGLLADTFKVQLWKYSNHSAWQGHDKVGFGDMETGI